MSEKKTAWANLGTLRQRQTKAGEKQSYIILSKDFEIRNTKTGETVNLGEYRQVKLMSPEKGLNTRLSNGSISEEDFQKQIDFIKEKNIKFELVVPPPETKV